MHQLLDISAGTEDISSKKLVYGWLLILVQFMTEGLTLLWVMRDGQPTAMELVSVW